MGWLVASSEFMGIIFQAAQLSHERFLTIEHSCKIFFISAKLNFYQPLVGPYVTYSTTSQFGIYQTNILQDWSMVKYLSCVSCAAWSILPINSLEAHCELFQCLPKVTNVFGKVSIRLLVDITYLRETLVLLREALSTRVRKVF